jgi:SAM-dependent methyltransferase
MNTSESDSIKATVREKYGQIATQSREQNASSCCGATCGCSVLDGDLMAEDYTKLRGYAADADLGLGCGLPTEFAQIREGDTVIDLGSGAGNDCFVARSLVGPSGKVLGVDFTEAMVEKARRNAEKLGYNNVEFRKGDIEALPVTSNVADVVVSNCVLNLVPDKKAAFQEMYRVLKPGGHFSVSDIVLDGEIPEALRTQAELYVGCISGAIQRSDYLGLLSEAGFSGVNIQKEKAIHLPDDLVSSYLTADQFNAYKASRVGIYSITVYGEKATSTAPSREKEACCGPDCCN